MDLVIETGAFLTDILRKISAACSEAVELCGKLHHILHRHGAGVGAVIAGFIFFTLRTICILGYSSPQ